MTIRVVGVNHKTAAIDLREQVAFNAQDIDRALPLLAAHADIHEAVIISTCNRVELYCVGAFEETIRDWLVEHKQIACPQTFAERCYYYEGIQAVEHLMRVACGLDSLVLGEPQILGQVKTSYAQACLHKTVGPQLSRLFQQVFHVAKKIRTSTQLGVCPVSVAAVSVKVAQTWLGQLASRVLIVGSGNTSRLAALHMMKTAPTQMTIVGRNHARTQALAQEARAVAAEWRSLPALLAQHNVIITATSSPHCVIDKAMLSASTPRLIIDLAVPRDVDAAVATVPHTQLYCIDDLKLMMNDYQHMRVHAAQQAENLIAHYAREFMLSLRMRDGDEIIKQYRGLLESQCELHLEKALQQLKQGLTGEHVLQTFARNLTNEIMHVPSAQLKRASSEGRMDMVNLAYELFGLA